MVIAPFSNRHGIVGGVVIVLLILFTAHELNWTPAIKSTPTESLGVPHGNVDAIPDPVPTGAGGLPKVPPETLHIYTTVTTFVTTTEKAATPSATLLHAEESQILPAEYYPPSIEGGDCARQYGTELLQRMSRNLTNYCDVQSKSSLICFHSDHGKDRDTFKPIPNSFCVSEGVEFDQQWWTLDCQMRTVTENEIASGIPKIADLPSYWGGSGPRNIMKEYLQYKLPSQSGSAESREHVAKKGTRPSFTILVRREDNVGNLWHSLLGIFSLSLNLDVLRMTTNPLTNEPYYMDADVPNTRIVVLDDKDDGPCHGLWNMFSPHPIIKMNSNRVSDIPIKGNLIIPWPGPANPLWEGDWVPHNCKLSPLIDAFSRRVLTFYQSDPKSEPQLIDDKAKLVFTFIDRRDNRKLVDTGAHINRLRARFPHVEFNVVDFALLTLPVQIQQVRQSNILVGVHGAGLTQQIFMNPGSAVVEILPPDFKYEGFRNLAKLKGHQYFSTHGDWKHAPDEGADNQPQWKVTDLVLDEEKFLELMSIAIKSMYNSGVRHLDIV